MSGFALCLKKSFQNVLDLYPDQLQNLITSELLGQSQCLVKCLCKSIHDVLNNPTSKQTSQITSLANVGTDFLGFTKRA